MRLEFTKNDMDSNLCYKVDYGDHLILILRSIVEIEKLSIECKRELTSKFNMKGLILMHYFLRLEAWKRPDEIFLKQREYIIDILRDSWW